MLTVNWAMVQLRVAESSGFANEAASSVACFQDEFYESQTMKKHLGLFVLIGFAGLLLAVPLPKYEPLPAPILQQCRGQREEPRIADAVFADGNGTEEDLGRNFERGLRRSIRIPGNGQRYARYRGRSGASQLQLRERVNIFFYSAVMWSTGRAGETTLPDVNVYEPLTDRWFRAEDMPVPVDDSVVGVHRDRYIYLVSGWSKTDAVNDVQVYDAQKNKWSKATPIPGTPVFGHAGGAGRRHDCVCRRRSQESGGRSTQVRCFGRMLDGQD